MSIKFSQREQQYLMKLVMSDVRRLDQLADHAAAHGQEVYLPDHSLANDIRSYLLVDWRKNAES